MGRLPLCSGSTLLTSLHENRIPDPVRSLPIKGKLPHKWGNASEEFLLRSSMACKRRNAKLVFAQIGFYLDQRKGDFQDW